MQRDISLVFFKVGRPPPPPKRSDLSRLLTKMGQFQVEPVRKGVTETEIVGPGGNNRAGGIVKLDWEEETRKLVWEQGRYQNI